MTQREKEFLDRIKKPLTFCKKIEAIADYYGKENQCRILAEECAELAKEALKAIRCGYSNIEALAEEIADVTIMMLQVTRLMEIDHISISVLEEAKTDRQIERIKAEIEAKNKE